MFYWGHLLRLVTNFEIFLIKFELYKLSQEENLEILRQTSSTHLHTIENGDFLYAQSIHNLRIFVRLF